ncbi:MAG: hypothetical protein IPN62_04910 [Flavobacteriales bacterium]|jgi:hypothetical protein|nr:hypothetical protein [Flavobacteriales bacterium]MBP7449430.1 hypothetical protein [Flavobacteriales bacterium]HOZ41742.1 hypothetical protein [Flavobacteriales bacterium]
MNVTAKRPILIVLLTLNAIVLLGQLWPEGAPPFARVVNIVFLLGSLGYFLLEMMRKDQ